MILIKNVECCWNIHQETIYYDCHYFGGIVDRKEDSKFRIRYIKAIRYSGWKRNCPQYNKVKSTNTSNFTRCIFPNQSEVNTFNSQ